MGNKILVVDDEKGILKVIETRLVAGGYQVVTAKNGIEGLQKVSQESPDLIISDVMMPEMDGFAFYKELKAKEETKNIPFLILTSRSKMEDTFIAMGADDFITKPFNQEELFNKIRGRIGGGIQSQESATKEEEKKDNAPKEEAPQEQALFGVLIAGNSQPVVEKIGSRLKDKNCKVQTLINGSDVISKSQEFKPNFIILEVLMGGVKTKDVIAKLRKSSDFKQTPIVAFSCLDKTNPDASAHQEKADIESARTACIEAGCTEFIGNFEGSEESSFSLSIDKYLPKA